MVQQLEQSVIGILSPYGATVGTGFVVTDQLAVTCAHVIKAAGSDRGESVHIKFFSNEDKQVVQVISEGWSSLETNDVAFLQLERLPEGVIPVVLGTADNRSGHQYGALGFAKVANYEARFAFNNLGGVVPVPDKHKRPMLQLIGDEIKAGMSGAPILDIQSHRVVGMVSEYKDDERTRFVWATTSDTLFELNPVLRLWPNVYGPSELNTYLDYLIDENQFINLPDGSEVFLERIYVSLRADEMNAAERNAEHDLFLEDVEKVKQMMKGAASDQYAEFEAMRKAIARHPKMKMLDARNWTRLFGKRKHSTLSLAEVVRRHPHVVLLGDPGSGKTTLGKWLVLQFARAFRQNKTHVLTLADLVLPGTGANDLVNLGAVRLPILIRIADYARIRWDKEKGNSKLTLEQFLGSREEIKYLPHGLSKEAIEGLSRDFLVQGRALVILDGLDEVSDPDQRLEVMQEVKKFIYGRNLVAGKAKASENRILLTSRIVGYQFHPLTDLPHYTIEDMDETAIAVFCQAWMMNVAKVEVATEHAQKLKHAIFDHSHPGVRTLAGNPLLLTILAQVYWNNTERILPTRRVALFDASTKAMYDQRKDFWNRVNIPAVRLTRALGAVAVHIHANEKTGFAEEGTIRERLGSVLLDSEQVEAVLEAAREVSGFLVARGEGVYGFLHRSIQEYFVAQYLVDQPARVANNLVERLFDVNWRETVILAIGLVSERRYPNSRRHLTETFDALFKASDFAGDFLPRRELLAALACAECERVPPETKAIPRIVENLLTVYAKFRGRSQSTVLTTRIQRAFIILRNDPVKEQVEAALCEVLLASNFERRSAAIDIIIETKWDTPAIAQSLVKAWYTYADPAASLLTILDEMIKRHPDYFQENFLPLRQIVTADPILWKNILANQEWKAIVSILYLPWGAEFVPELINRDSPLTPMLLTALRQPFSSKVLTDLRQRLVSLTGQMGHAIARDAALALSVLGDTSWVSAIVANADTNGSQLCSIMSVLALSLDTNTDLTDTFTNTLSIVNELIPILDQISDYVNTLDSKRISARTEAITRIRDNTYNPLPDLDYKLSVALYDALRLADNPYSSSAHSSNIERNLIGARSLLAFFYQEITQDRTFINEFDNAFKHVSALKNARRFSNLGNSIAINRLASTLAIDIEQLRKHVQEINIFAINNREITRLVDQISEEIDGEKNLFFNRIFDQISTHAQYIKSYLNAPYSQPEKFDLRTHLRNCDFARDLKLILAVNLGFASILGIISFRANEMRRYLSFAYIIGGGEDKLVKMLQKASLLTEKIQNFFTASAHIDQVLGFLIEECAKKWTAKSHSPVSSSESYEITAGTFESLIADLTSDKDLAREHAQQVLEAKHLASALGKTLIEQIANTVYRSADNPRIENYLLWSLQEIIHDQPSWIIHWVEQVKSSQGDSLARIILGSIHRVIPETLMTILDCLPNSSPHVNMTLLNSLSWLARLKRLPKRKLLAVRDLLLSWLAQETELDIRCAIVEVLGNWQEDLEVVCIELINKLNHPGLESDYPFLYKALAKLAAHRSSVATRVRALLQRRACTDYAAIVALVRLSLMEDKENILQLHKILAKSDKYQHLTALLDAGSDDDIWRDEYHGILATAIQTHLELHTDLLPVLLAKLQEALLQQIWPLHRIALAAVAACIEVMPVAVQRSWSGNLEVLLVNAAADPRSFNSRRFALTALSYLRTITPAIVPALLAGCKDTEIVQLDAIVAASRFETIQGDLLSSLIPLLNSESVSIAYAVTRLLGALGSSSMGESANQREQIIEALVNALKAPTSQREIVIVGENRGKLEDVFYTALLEAAGWVG